MGLFTPHRPATTILPGHATPLWPSHAQATDCPHLAGTVTVDVAIVGAGIVGLSAARLLKEAGRSVAIVEASRVGRQATALSTAKVTSQHGAIYHQLIDHHGMDVARAYGEANQAALERVAAFVNELGIGCNFERTDSYVYAERHKAVMMLRREAVAAQSLGLAAEYLESVPLPFPAAAAVRFRNQAKIDPARYLLGLAVSIPGDGSHVFENSRVTKIEHGSPCRIYTDRGTVVAADVIVATHLPAIPQGQFHRKVQPYAHVMVAAPAGVRSALAGMFLSVDGQPSHSFRNARIGAADYLVAVGGTYRAGDAGEAYNSFMELERFVQSRFGIRDIPYRWTNEDYNSADGLPLIGQADTKHPHLWVATGFGAWGITNGTLAGMILAARITGAPHPWSAALDSVRAINPLKRPAAVREGAQMVSSLLSGYLRPRPRNPEDLKLGESRVFSLHGEKVAVHRDAKGGFHAVSAKCTHMGCVVGWNPVDNSWDCPCHGSRFGIDGEVLHAPALAPLARRNLPRK